MRHIHRYGGCISNYGRLPVQAAIDGVLEKLALEQV